MQARSIHGKSSQELQKALILSMAEGFNPTLAIVFMSVKQDRNAVCEILRNMGIDVFGATSCGEFTNGYQDEGSIVMLLLDLTRDAYTILFEPVGADTIKEVSTRVAKKTKDVFEKPALIVCSTGLTDDGEFFDGGTLVKSLESALGREVTFFGGGA